MIDILIVIDIQILIINSLIHFIINKFLMTTIALRKLCFHFLSNRMGYDRGDSFSFNFEQNGIPFGRKLKVKLSPRSYPMQFERKWIYSILSVHTEGGVDRVG